MAEVWERQSGESMEAYRAFCVYRDLGASRSLDDAYRAATGKNVRERSGRWAAWCTANRWRERAQEYDLYRERQARLRREQENTQELEEYRKRQRQMAAASMQTAVSLISKASARLKDVKPEELSPAMLPSYFRAAAAIAQAATDAEAQALGIGELLRMLDDANGTEPR